MSDIFRPHTEPARRIYDAIVDESRHRKSRTLEEWITLEQKRVLDEATRYAKWKGVDPPTAEQIERCEWQAVGHIDYAAKWAYAVAELFR